MSNWKKISLACMAVSCLMFSAGCAEEPKKSRPSAQRPVKKPSDTAAQPKPREKPKSRATGPKEVVHLPSELTEEAPKAMPRVLLTSAHAASSLVKVDDTLPDAELPDLSGRKQKLTSLLGEKYSVVLFWAPAQPFAREELADLRSHIAAAYGNQGVRIVAICVRGTTEQSKRDLQSSDPGFPVLVDTSGEYFARVATVKLPRTYLVDSAGKILWFDLEYSRSTRRELSQALRFLLPADNAQASAAGGR